MIDEVERMRRLFETTKQVDDSFGKFEHVLEVDAYFTMPPRTVTATRIDDRSVRLATSCDAIRIENLDDAIEALCELRQAQDPEGYMAFVVERLTPRMTMSDAVPVYRDLAGSKGPHSGTVSAEGRITTVLDDEDIEGITGRKP